MELYKAHRPRTLSQIRGQREAVKLIQGWIDSNQIPHAILFSGGSGVGKTTLARILAKHLECGDADFHEINASNDRSIDFIREIEKTMWLSPMSGKCRIWLLDEVHSLTHYAQQCCLKMLEDTPKHVYFFLATTEPEKLIKTIRTRCTDVFLKNLNTRDMEVLLNEISEQEKFELQDEVLVKIIELAEGSARKALVLLDKVIRSKGKREQLAILEAEDTKNATKNLVSCLLNPRCSWGEISEVLKGMQDDPEQIRRMILGVASSILLKKASNRCYLILTAFEDTFMHSGKAGLIRACYEVMSTK